MYIKVSKDDGNLNLYGIFKLFLFFNDWLNMPINRPNSVIMIWEAMKTSSFGQMIQ